MINHIDEEKVVIYSSYSEIDSETWDYFTTIYHSVKHPGTVLGTRELEFNIFDSVKDCLNYNKTIHKLYLLDNLSSEEKELLGLSQ